MESYNPLETSSIGESVVRKLLSREPRPLTEIETFKGAGIYAIYYAGGFTPYAPYRNDSETGTFDTPIYIGKAIPAGARKGGKGTATDPGYVLFNRLKEHLESIRQAANLDENDFYYRYLVVDDVWIPLGESLMISKYIPVWNVQITGFGNHDPGAGRYKQKRSLWDTVHPGRPWAMKCEPAMKSSDQILEAVKDSVPLTIEVED